MSGKCLYCKDIMMIVSLDGKTPMFCDKCREMIRSKTKASLEKRGHRIGNKTVVFPDGK
jgi:hypothetical protein